MIWPVFSGSLLLIHPGGVSTFSPGLEYFPRDRRGEQSQGFLLQRSTAQTPQKIFGGSAQRGGVEKKLSHDADTSPQQVTVLTRRICLHFILGGGSVGAPKTLW